MGFVDNLRMSGIYGPNGQGNFGSAPDFNMGGGMDPNAVLSTIYNLRKKQAEDEMYRNIQMSDRQRRLNQQDQAFQTKQQQMTDATKPMNVNPPLYPDEADARRREMNDFQQATIAANAAKLKQTGDIAQAKDVNADQDRALKFGNATADRAIRQQRADTYDFKTKHPNAQILTPKGGNYMLLDPITREVHDSGVSTGTMTQEDFQNQLQSGRETITGMQGENAANTQTIRNQGSLADIAARTAGQIQLKGSPSSSTKITTPNATQQRAADWNAAQKVINSRPDLSQFISVGPGGQFSIQPPSTGGFFGASGPTKAQYDELNKLIYGENKPSAQPPVTQPPTAPTSKYKVEIK